MKLNNCRPNFPDLKNSPRLATRYDKTAASFPGGVGIASIRLRIRQLAT